MKKPSSRPQKSTQPAIKRSKNAQPVQSSLSGSALPRSDFEQVLQLIESSRHHAFQAVNVAMIELYWSIGEHISRKIAAAQWGDGVVNDLADFLARSQPGLKGFSRQNLFRMRQFYEAYRDHEMVSALLRQLSWTHHLIILGQAKLPEEREFYMRMTLREKWSSRELERQFRTALFERVVLSPPKVSAALSQTQPDAASVFKDSYVLEFLGLPEDHSESDLHRGMNCLVALELKIDRFEPEHLGKLGFYLEALDRDLKKPHENPSIGVLLCASKDSEVVEYALSRSLSPALIAQYQTQLPNRTLLQRKLHEFYQQLAPSENQAPAKPKARTKR